MTKNGAGKVSQVDKLVQFLSRFKLCEFGEHDEGYDGHLEWNGKDEKIVEAKTLFSNAHKKKNAQLIERFVQALVPSDDGRLNAILLLLNKRSCDDALKEALLIAISIGSRPLTELILGIYVDSPYFERTGCANSLNFPPHMTPLMLACILNNFSIVQCLLLRGHSIPLPHFKSCQCDICRKGTIHSRVGTRMVDIMRAISSEAYLWLATDDVYAASCAMSQDLRQMMEEDDLEFIETYRVLEANVQRFLARISDSAWRSEEFLTLVSNKDYCSSRNCRFSAPRLQMAFDSHMRQFACTSNVQSTMMGVFWGDWRNFGNSFKRDTWRILRCTLFSPFLSFLHSINPWAFTTCEIPAARFISHIFSYFIFLIASMTRLALWDGEYSVYLESFMYIYMLGLVVEKSMLMHRIGPNHYFSFWWRWFDAIMITAFIMSFISFVSKYTEREEFDPSTIDRKHWPATEPILVHEIFLAVSCTIAIGKVFYYMQLLKKIGGSVISVGKCIGKVYTYIIIMLIVIVAFSIGMNIITTPYVSRKTSYSGGALPKVTTASYESLTTSTKNLFWSIFGYLGPSSYITAVGNTGPNLEPVDHVLNSATLEILGALYHGIIIITLMNLMTSLLVKKADEVLDNEEMEFKYTRAMLYSEFLSWEMAVPPPLNLFCILFHWFYRFEGKLMDPVRKLQKDEPNAMYERIEKRHEIEIEKTPNEEGKAEKKQKWIRCGYFANVMIVLFERFVSSKECKYKSIWRTEFKDEKLYSRVAYLNPLSRPIQQDNLYHKSHTAYGFDGKAFEAQKNGGMIVKHKPAYEKINRRFQLYQDEFFPKKK